MVGSSGQLGRTVSEKNSDLDQYPAHHFPRIRNAKGWPGWKPRADTAPVTGKTLVNSTRKRYSRYADGASLLIGIGIIVTVMLFHKDLFYTSLPFWLGVALSFFFGLQMLLKLVAHFERKRVLRSSQTEKAEGALKSNASLSVSIKRRLRLSAPSAESLFRVLMIQMLSVMLVSWVVFYIGLEIDNMPIIYSSIGVCVLGIMAVIVLAVLSLRKAS